MNDSNVFIQLTLIFGFRNRNMVGEDNYTNAEIRRGINVLKSIKRRPNLSLKEFRTSFIGKKVILGVLIYGLGKLNLPKCQFYFCHDNEPPLSSQITKCAIVQG